MFTTTDVQAAEVSFITVQKPFEHMNRFNVWF